MAEPRSLSRIMERFWVQRQKTENELYMVAESEIKTKNALIPPREVCDFCTPAPCLCLCGRRHGGRIRSVLENPSLYFSRCTDSFLHLHNSLSTLENTRIPLLQFLTEGRTGSATRISDRRRPRIRGDLSTAQLAQFSNPLPNHALHNPTFQTMCGAY
jgi:hypothetical protein